MRKAKGRGVSRPKGQLIPVLEGHFIHMKKCRGRENDWVILCTVSGQTDAFAKTYACVKATISKGPQS